MPLSGTPYGYAGPPEAEFEWTDLIYGPTLVYTGAGKIYVIIFIAKSGSQRAEIYDNLSGTDNLLITPWASQYCMCTVINLAGYPIPFSTGLNVGWLSGTEQHLALKIGYLKD